MVEEDSKHKSAAELKAENDALEIELARKETITARMNMAGKAQISVPETPKVESNKEYRKRIEQELRDGKYDDRK